MSKDMDAHVNNLVDNLITTAKQDTLEEHYLRSWQALGVMCVHVANQPVDFHSICVRAEARNNLLSEIMTTEEKLADQFMEEIENGDV